MIRHLKLLLELTSIFLVIASAGLWAGAGLQLRPKNIDEQTLVGGTIWSQIIIPIGLLISQMVEEELDPVVAGFYLLSGVLLLWVTGIVLIVSETLRFMKRRRRQAERGEEQNSVLVHRKPYYDKEYYAIGALFCLAGGVKFTEFVFIILTGLLAFGAYWTTKYLMSVSDATSLSAINVNGKN